MARARSPVILELHTASRLVQVTVEQALLRNGLHPSLYAILSLIAMHEPITPTRLGQESGVRPTTLRDMIGEMTGAGHVETVANEQDRRSYFLTTTPAGKDFLRRADAIARGVEKELEQGLGAPLESYRGSLRELRRAARAVWVRSALTPD
jgi:DNA-binding MarR family transcriptional regulator